MGSFWTSGRLAWLAFGALLVFWTIGAYNRLMRLRGELGAAWAPLEAQLVQRQTLALALAAQLEPPRSAEAPALGAALEALVAATRQSQAATRHAHAQPGNAGALQSLGVAEQMVESALRAVLALKAGLPDREGEPGWEGAEPAVDIVAGLRETAGHLAFSRRRFNDTVAAFNEAVQEVPTRLVAALFGLAPAAPLLGGVPEGMADLPAVRPPAPQAAVE